MGNTLTQPSFVSTQQDIPTLLLDVPAYLHHSVLGGGKIFKTLQTLHEDGFVVLKVYQRRSSDFDLRRFELKLDELNAKLPLSQCPSILNLIKLEITERAVYLGRQYLGSNLVDRFHVHPSLHLIEKQWFTYQMFHAVHQLHSHGIRHGDIKTENFLLTSWNWLFLVDIAFYKPTFLPNDNPADYHFYFDSSQGTLGSNGMITQQARRRCYVAPERFFSQITDRKFQEPSDRNNGSGGSDGQVTEAMDIFSLGCVIAELFLHGESLLFDLPLLLAYREGEYDPTPVINKIPQAEVRALIRHMIQRDPTKRFSAKQYMKIWSSTVCMKPGGLEQLIQEQTIANNPNSVMSPTLFAASPPVTTPASFSLLASNSPPSSTSATTPSPLTSVPSTPSINTTTSAPAVSLNPPLFPPYFPYLYRFGAKLLTPELADPDIKIQALKTHRDAIVKEVLGKEWIEMQMKQQEDAKAAAAAQAESRPSSPAVPASSVASTSTSAPQGKDDITSFTSSLASKTSSLRSPDELQSSATTAQSKPAAASGTLSVPTLPRPTSSPALSPTSAPSAATLLDLASCSNSTPQLAPTSATNVTLESFTLEAITPAPVYYGNGLSVICSIICSCLQNVRYPITKLTALELLYDFGSYVDDEIRLSRLIPYTVALLADPSSMVRSTSCHILTKLLVQVESLNTSSDAHLFVEYLFPSLSRFPNDSEEIVRLAYAQNIADLAVCAKKFLDLSQASRVAAGIAPTHASGALNATNSPTSTSDDPNASTSEEQKLEPFDDIYFGDLATLQDTVLKLIIDMLTLGGPRPKRALLADITKLCLFMGKKRVNNELLPHLITVLNDRDWQLRSAFFEYIVGVSVFVGRIAFQNFVLPCIEQALFDVSEFVIQRAVHALCSLSQLGLFEKRMALEVCQKIVPLLCHPSAWIRSETIKFIASISATLGPAKTLVFLVPILRPFLVTTSVPDLSQESLHQYLKPHLTRTEFQKEVSPEKEKDAATAPITPTPQQSSQSMPTSSPLQSHHQQQMQLPPLQRAVTTPSRPVALHTSSSTSSMRHSSAAHQDPIVESYAGPSRLFDASNAVANSFMDPMNMFGPPGMRMPPTTKPPPPTMQRPQQVPEDRELDESSLSNVLSPDLMQQKSLLTVAPSNSSSGFRDDPALYAVMSSYLARVSSAIQAKSLQSPTGSMGSGSGSGSSSSILSNSNSGLMGVNHANTSNMDEESLMIEIQNLSLSTTLEEQLPLHQLEIEPTIPTNLNHNASSAQATAALDRASQETFDSMGVNMNTNNQRKLSTDPSVVQGRQVGGASVVGPTGVANAGAANQGQPAALRETLSLVPEYIKRALGIPAPPPSLGNLRADWTSYSTFYRNHHVLTTTSSSESLALADTIDPRGWRPKGVLVATLNEHRHVRSLAVSRDNLFLASGGDEGIVKIWDAQRLKLTAHARSQLSYVQQGRITSLCVCDSSHSVASASSNGSLHVFKVEYANSNDDSSSSSSSGGSQRYIGLSDVKHIDQDPVNGEGSILRVDHFNTLSESLLMYSTQKAIHGWDLRSKKEALEMKLEPAMGLITTMEIGPSPYVCVTGTNRGFIIVWDLRFQLPVQVWRHSARAGITCLYSIDSPSILPKEPTLAGMGHPHPTKGPLIFAAAEGTNQVSGFDIYTGESRMLFRILAPSSSTGVNNSTMNGAGTPGLGPRKGSFGLGSPASMTMPTPSSSSATSSGGSSASGQQQGSLASPSQQRPAARQKVRVSPLSLPSLRSYIRNDYTTSQQGVMSNATNYHAAYASSAGYYHSLMGVTIDDAFLREFSTLGAPDVVSSYHTTPASVNSLLVCKESFALTAGTDKKVRFWNLQDPTDSYRISSEEVSDADYLRYHSRVENTTVVFEEVLSNVASSDGMTTSSATPSTISATGAASASDPSSAAEAQHRAMRHRLKHAGQTPPSTAHTSEILDMKAFEYPQKMLATASRDGIIKIWI